MITFAVDLAFVYPDMIAIGSTRSGLSWHDEYAMVGALTAKRQSLSSGHTYAIALYLSPNSESRPSIHHLFKDVQDVMVNDHPATSISSHDEAARHSQPYQSSSVCKADVRERRPHIVEQTCGLLPWEYAGHGRSHDVHTIDEFMKSRLCCQQSLYEQYWRSRKSR